MEEIRQQFGDEFLCYVLHSDPGTVASSDPQWSDAQAAVIAGLVELSSRLPENPFERQHARTAIILQAVSPGPTSLANSWRVACGGKIASTFHIDGDECFAPLKAAAEYIYPCLLMRSPQTGPFAPDRSYAGTLHNHDGLQRFCDAVLRDEKLKRLFPGAPESLGDLGEANDLYKITADIIVSTGRGGSLQLVMLFETILKAAYDRVVLAIESGLDAYIKRVAEVLSEVRDLASGRRVSIPVVVGFKNIGLPSEARICMPSGEVRSPREADGRYLPQIDAATAVFITTTPMKVLRRSPWAPSDVDDPFSNFEKHSNSFEKHNKDLSRTVNLARYAFLCASSAEPYYAPMQVATSILDPLQNFPSMSWVSDRIVVASETTLDNDAVRRVEQWALRLESHPRSLDIAVRRTLSAVTDRLDPLDGFIDAVLAWENMFSDAPETTMKVCGAIAVLLERYSFEERNLLYKELQEMYSRRSKIVHGAPEPGQQEAVKLRGRAIEIAIKAMKALYGRGDNGLLDLDSSSARGKQILLGVLDF